MSRKLVLVTALTLIFVGIFGVSVKVKRGEADGTIFIRTHDSIDSPTANIASSNNLNYTFTGNIMIRFLFRGITLWLMVLATQFKEREAEVVYRFLKETT